MSIENAKFIIKNDENTIELFTDENGRVVFDSVPAGTYDIIVEKEGYELYKNPERVEINKGRPVHLKIRLTPLADVQIEARDVRVIVSPETDANVILKATGCDDYEVNTACKGEAYFKDVPFGRYELKVVPYDEYYGMITRNIMINNNNTNPREIQLVLKAVKTVIDSSGFVDDGKEEDEDDD